MLPHIDYSDTELTELLALTLIGDLVDKADTMSVERFLEQRKNHPEIKIDDVSEDTFIAAIKAQNVKGIPLEVQQKFLAFASDRQQIKRAIIADIVSNKKNSLGLDPVEGLLITSFSSMAALFDQFLIEWRERIIYSEIGRLFAQDPDKVPAFREEHGLSTAGYVYSVIKQEGDTYVEESFISAFPEIIRSITDELRKLTDALLIHDADVELIDYLNGYIDLLLNEEPAKAEFFAKDLDSLWLQIQGRVIPVHGMEIYLDPGKVVVEPELSLEMIDDRYGKVNMGIIETRKKMFAYLGERYKDVEAYHASLSLMEKAQAGVYSPTVEGGTRLCIKPMGFNVPNWMEVRQSVGVRIFISMQAAITRWESERVQLLKLFGEDVVRKEFDPIAEDGSMHESAGIVSVGGHEIAHNAFLKPDVQDRLTNPLYALLEEAKASLAIISGIDELYDLKDQLIALKQQTSYAIAKLTQMGDGSVMPYVNYAISFLNAAFASGMLNKHEDLYSLEFNSSTAKKAVQELKKVFDAMVAVYDHGGPEDAKAFIQKFFTPGRDVQAIIDFLKSSS